jgi:hypothetical protein
MLEQAVEERRLDIMPLPNVCLFLVLLAPEYRFNAHIFTHKIEDILGRTLEIGKALLRKSWGEQVATNALISTPTHDTESVADGKTAVLAVKWLQKTFQVVERVDNGANSNLAALRVCFHFSRVFLDT